MTHGNTMNKPYDKRIPALLQSKTNLTDAVNISVKREFIEGYVLVNKWRKFGPESPLLVSAQETEIGGVDTYIKVKVIIDE
jgi:hypothetical protein